MSDVPTLTEAYQQGRDDEYEYTKIQIEMVDKLCDALNNLIKDLEGDIEASLVFGTGLMNAYVVKNRVDKAKKEATKIALDTLVAEGEILGLYDE